MINVVCICSVNAPRTFLLHIFNCFIVLDRVFSSGGNIDSLLHKYVDYCRLLPKVLFLN